VVRREIPANSGIVVDDELAERVLVAEDKVRLLRVVPDRAPKPQRAADDGEGSCDEYDERRAMKFQKALRERQSKQCQQSDRDESNHETRKAHLFPSPAS